MTRYTLDVVTRVFAKLDDSGEQQEISLTYCEVSALEEVNRAVEHLSRISPNSDRNDAERVMQSALHLKWESIQRANKGRN